jgi:hypothetical protein
MDKLALQKVKADCFDKIIGKSISYRELGRLIVYLADSSENVEYVFGEDNEDGYHLIGQALDALDRETQLQILRPHFTLALSSHLGAKVSIDWE